MTETTAAHGEHTTNGIPHGSTSITPHLAVAPAAEAIDFYRDVLGARVIDVTEIGDVVVHAELDFGHGRLTLSEPSPDYDLAAPGEQASYSLGLYLPDVDAVFARAASAGVQVREKPTTFVSGDRFASIIDPFGVRWTLMTRVEDLSDAESARRVAEWAAKQSV